MMKLTTKITLLVSLLVVLILGTFSMTLYNYLNKEMILNIERNCMNIAQILAQDEYIIERLHFSDRSNNLQLYVDQRLKSIEHVEYIVVLDMNRRRYSHPNDDLIGLKGIGEDIEEAFYNGKSYVSKGKGALGEAIRAFVPIYNVHGIQVGIVVVGILLDSVEQLSKRYFFITNLFAFIGISVGFIGAVMLSRGIKKSIKGLEPYEIARLHNEKEGMINAIKEGMISIDNNKKITVINKAAVEILSIESDNVDLLIGESIDDIFPENKLSEFLETGNPEYNKQEVIGDVFLVFNRIPIYSEDKIVGAISTFSDRTKVVEMAEEITGIRQISEGLRATNHEFKNKLHVILGLIHNKKYNELEEYVVRVSDSQKVTAVNISRRIKNYQIEALLIGKMSRANELGIELKIFDDSCLGEESVIYNNHLVTIIGNLLENAFESVVKNKVMTERKVYLGILDMQEAYEIIVDDTGVGIDKYDIDKIYDKGYSTKHGSSGTGLYLVKENVDALKGTIFVDSAKGMGTHFHITLRKVAYD